MSDQKSDGERRILSEEVHHEAQLELLCNKCGLCCHNKVWFTGGQVVVHPTEACEYLGPDRRCTIYERRFELCPTCLNRKAMVENDFVLPEGCPYTSLREDYKPAKVVSEDEFRRICDIEAFFSTLPIDPH